MSEKIGSPILARMPISDSSFAEVFIAIRNIGIFYGTDAEENRDDYLAAIQKALNSRIAEPIVKWSQDPWSCFFKPYSNRNEGVKAAIFGLSFPLLALLGGLGLIGVVAATPILLVYCCMPAIVELLVGIVGLGQALWCQAQASFSFESEKEQSEAGAYFLDAITRFALVIPLAVVSLAATPIDLVRFTTRSIATLIDYFPSAYSVADYNYSSILTNY